MDALIIVRNRTLIARRIDSGSHLPEIGNWLQDVSAGQSIYSPHEVHLFPYAGYHFCSHTLATNWLLPRKGYPRTWHHETSPVGQHGTIWTGFRALQQSSGSDKSLSGNKTKGKTLFCTLTQNATNSQFRSGVLEKSAHHFTSLENAPFGIICPCICPREGIYSPRHACIVAT